MRRFRDRNKLISDIVAAWLKLDPQEKFCLVTKQPDLYFALARLAAHETVASEMARRP